MKLLLIILISIVIFSSYAQDDSIIKEKDDIDLQSLTNEQLEEICTSRGFELVDEVDEQTGQPKEYSHDDYVNAAKQCLQIEGEMEDILRENPELVDDLEAETQNMLEEKDRLEKELVEAQSKLRKEERKGDNNAFVNRPPSDKAENNTNTREDNEKNSHSESTIMEDMTDDEVINLDEIEEEKQINDIPSQATDTQSVTTKNQESSVGKDSDNVTKEPVYTVEEVFREFKEQFMKDFVRVRDKIQPFMDALRPVLRISKNAANTIFDLLKRNILAMLEAAKDKAEGTEKGTPSAEKLDST